MTDSSKVIQNAPLDPDIHDWCSKSRLNLLNSYFSNSAEFLTWACCLDEVLTKWVRYQLISEIADDNLLSQAKKDTKLAEKILTGWANDLWGHRLESIYLSQKHGLDRVTCSLIRVSDKNLAFELYQRLRSNEASFEYLSWNYAEGEEKVRGGRFKNTRVQALPAAMHSLLRKIKPGQVLKPHKLGNYYSIIKLDEFIPAQFDEETQRLLLKCELNAWIKAVAEHLSGHL